MDYFVEKRYDSAEEGYQAALDYMSEILEEFEPPVSPHNESVQSIHNRSNVTSLSLAQLPKISLPPFNGNIDEWEQFRDRFSSLIIQNPDLSQFARMHFLTSCVKGRALECIANVPVTAANFDVAWKALVTRYENKGRLLQLHLSTLLNLPAVCRESAAEIQSLRDKVNIAVSSLNQLPRSAEQLWNDILVHVVVQRIDPVTRKAWKLRTTDCDEPPTFADLDKFLASRTRTLEELASVPSVKFASRSASVQKVNIATASASPASQCPICKTRHYFSECPSFVRGSPTQRRELVKKHGRCYNCLSQSHSVLNCKSKYSCRTCFQRHHSMLHMSSGPVVASSIEASADPVSPSGDIKSEVHSLLASPIKREPSRVLFNPLPRQIQALRVHFESESGKSVAVAPDGENSDTVKD